MANKFKVLIVEDEISISNFIATTLKANGYTTLLCSNGKEALSMIASHCPDVILLDLGLPDIDGLEILKQLRQWSGIPVIIVSARVNEEEKVEALDTGADDYITKPFGTSELLARIRTAIRHASNNIVQNDKFSVKGLSIDFGKRLVIIDGKEVHLTQIEFKIVSLLAKSQGRVLTYDQIIAELWGPYAVKDNQILRVNMANIRRKIEKNPAEPQYIFTEIGVGYRMVEE
ncbi:response regulator transcription factor [Clostridium sp. MD294]|uniref:response regulator n=1 Tax=Clostridium sp. MD294 TaxID=97138 RepID=UPI0002C994B7|nr:response regulator transcription factor [Clostridium sp. MD294]NDO45651.1 response regulator transcription factor [Clostridium sp. MD294]USF30694.1 KDP operon transcriptional regulatory protein KdpE [Clostridium sp. MD294]